MAMPLDKMEVDTGHKDFIHDAEMNASGTKLATCSGDRKVRIFDVNLSNGSQGLVQELSGHEGPVWQLAWAHAAYGPLIASCSYDCRVILWSETKDKSWERLFTYEGHHCSVNSVCWAPPSWGLMLACGSSDCSISLLSCSNLHGSNQARRQWDVEKIVEAHGLGCNAVTWAPSVETGKVSTSPVMRFASGGCDATVKIWRGVNGVWAEEARLEGHTDWVRDVAWCPLVGETRGRSRIASSSHDRRVLIWTTTNGLDEEDAVWSLQILFQFDDVVWYVSWSLTGDLLSAAGGDNQVSLWREKQVQVDNQEAGGWECISGLEPNKRVSQESTIILNQNGGGGGGGSGYNTQ